MAARLGVTSANVTSAALAIVKRGNELTVAEVARQLECKPPSIYHHVPDGLFGLNEMVHRHCRQWLHAELQMQLLPSVEGVMWMLWRMAQKQRWLYDFHADEWEHEYVLRSQLPTHLLPLLAVMTHDYTEQLLKEIFDAE